MGILVLQVNSITVMNSGVLGITLLPWSWPSKHPQYTPQASTVAVCSVTLPRVLHYRWWPTDYNIRRRCHL